VHYFYINELLESKEWKDASLYFRPSIRTCPGIDSIAFETDESGTVTGVVFFQFTIAETHAIKTKLIKMIQEDKDAKQLKWKLVFVTLDNDRIEKLKKQRFEPKPKIMIEQFVCKIQLDESFEIL
jgi:hypothetical protein